jgi:protein SCO1/2
VLPVLVGLAASSCQATAPVAAPAPAYSAPIPNPVLTTHEGRAVRFYDDLVRDRVVVVQFFYVECAGICPLSTTRMLEMQDALQERAGRDVSLLSITLDPANDTPDVLAQHARAVGAGPGWTFLTGSEQDILSLRRRLGVFDRDPVLDADRSQHAAVLVLGNDSKQRWCLKPATLSSAFLLRSLLRLAGPRQG